MDRQRRHITELERLARLLDDGEDDRDEGKERLPSEPKIPSARRPKVKRSKDEKEADRRQAAEAIPPTPEPERDEEDENEALLSDRRLMRAIDRLVDDDDRRDRRRREGGGNTRLMRFLGAGGPSNFPEGFPGGGLPDLGGGGGAGDGGGGAAAKKVAKKAVKSVADVLRSPDAVRPGDTTPTRSRFRTGRTGATGTTYQRPTSGIWQGRGPGAGPMGSPVGAGPLTIGPGSSGLPEGGGGLPLSRRVGSGLNQRLEGLLDTLIYDNADTMLGQLAGAVRSADDLNDLARRAGVDDELAGVRGRGSRLRRLARALNRQYGGGTPNIGEPLTSPGVTAGPVGRTIRRGRGAMSGVPGTTPETRELDYLEGQLADARKRARRLGGPTSGSRMLPAQQEAADEVAELQQQVNRARSRINPNPAFWRQRDLQQALEDGGLSPLAAQQATGMVPESSAIVTGMPREALGRPVRIRRPVAGEPVMPETEPFLPPDPIPGVPGVFGPVEKRRGSILGVPSHPRRLSDAELNGMGGDLVLSAFRQGQVLKGDAGARLDKLADEADAAASSSSGPDAAVFRAEAGRLRSMASGIRSGITTSGIGDSLPDGSGGGTGLVLLSVNDIRDTLSRLETPEQAVVYLNSLHITEPGLRALAESLGVGVDESLTGTEVIELIAGTVVD